MKYEWIDEYCLAKLGAMKDFKMEWNAFRYLIGGKMFAMEGGDKYKKAIITLKCDPPFGELLRQQYKDIIPGYYMNKEHWNSVYLEGDVPDEILKDMIDMSYQLVFSSLTKNAQSEIIVSYNGTAGCVYRASVWLERLDNAARAAFMPMNIQRA